MKGVIFCLMGVFALTMAATPLEELEVAYNKYQAESQELLDYIKTLSSGCAERVRKRIVVYSNRDVDNYYNDAQFQMEFIQDYVARNSLVAVNEGLARLDYYRQKAVTDTNCESIY